MSISDRIRICADLAGSGDELARKANIPRSTLETYLTSQSEIKAGRIVAICAATGVAPTWLLTGEGEMLRAAAAKGPVRELDMAKLETAIGAANALVEAANLSMNNKQYAKLLSFAYQVFMGSSEDDAMTALRQAVDMMVDLVPKKPVAVLSKDEEKLVAAFREATDHARRVLLASAEVAAKREG